ncbi:MAG: hypothetical protein K2M65_05360 [Muribaculaceae bacterium]|nr:hypothetical protein [Muribaculaceae bacterium]
MGKILKGIFASTLLTALCACNTNGCLENQNSIPLAGFYSMRTKQAVTVSQMQIGGVSAPNDTLLLESGSASEIYLPFRANTGETSFYFRLTQTSSSNTENDTPTVISVSDTITFHYKAYPYFASTDCGAMFRYEITDYAHTSLFIDSVAVTDSLITNVDIQRIHIYFRDDDNDAENK